MTMHSASRIQDIELLRAIAIVLVFLQHIPHKLLPWLPPALTQEGYSFAVGVDLFLVVSGFVIARSLLPELAGAANPRERVAVMLAFWIRRAWRLWPAAWLWLLLILVAVILFNRSGVFGGLVTNLEATVAGVLQVANIRVNELFLVRPYGVSDHYWGLSLEEQFYLAFPLLVILFPRQWLWILAALIVSRFIWGGHLSVYRFEGMALGVLIAVFMRHSERGPLLAPDFLRFRSVAWALLLLGVALMVLLGDVQRSIVTVGQPLITILAGLLVLAAAQDRDYFRLPRVIQPVALWIGSRSYALYLCHIPMFYGTRELWFRYGIQAPDSTDTLRFGVLGLLLSGVAAELTYRLVEQPGRRRGRHHAEALITSVRATSSATDSSGRDAPLPAAEGASR